MIDTRYLSRLSCSISISNTIRITIREIKMAKQSYIKAIKSKQSSPYSGVPRTPQAMHDLGVRGEAIKGFPPRNGVSEATKDAQAERIMNPHNWSARKNPICPVCRVQKSIGGECYC